MSSRVAPMLDAQRALAATRQAILTSLFLTAAGVTSLVSTQFFANKPEVSQGLTIAGSVATAFGARSLVEELKVTEGCRAIWKNFTSPRTGQSYAAMMGQMVFGGLASYAGSLAAGTTNNLPLIVGAGALAVKTLCDFIYTTPIRPTEPRAPAAQPVAPPQHRVRIAAPQPEISVVGNRDWRHQTTYAPSENGSYQTTVYYPNEDLKDQCDELYDSIDTPEEHNAAIREIMQVLESSGVPGTNPLSRLDRDGKQLSSRLQGGPVSSSILRRRA